jgi:hypothetical protein
MKTDKELADELDAQERLRNRGYKKELCSKCNGLGHVTSRGDTGVMQRPCTEAGCQEYLRLNGHNDRRRAHNGEVQIYVESFNRCPEMIAIREALMANEKLTQDARP